MTPFLFYDVFFSYLSVEKRYSDHTIIAYIKDVEQFFEFSPIEDVKGMNEITNKTIRSWVVNNVEKGSGGRTINRKLASLRTYFKLLQRNGVLANNPAKMVQGPKVEKRLPAFVDDLKRREVTSVDFPVRDALLVELFYQTGIRLSELVELKVVDVDDSKIKVIGKGNKERLIPISPLLYASIIDYRASLPLIFRENPSLLLTDSGKKLYPKFVYRKINAYLSVVANVKKNSPHVLRHTFATHMLNNGAGLEVIKELLGHTSLAATQVYTHNSFAKLNSIYSQAHPRGVKKKSNYGGES